MTRIAWPQLMRLGYRQLGLAPEVFWDLTPAELMLMAGTHAHPGALTRKRFLDLATQFPDTPRGGKLESE